MGPAAHHTVAWPHWPAPKHSPRHPGRTPFRRPSPPATPAPSVLSRPTGARLAELYEVLAETRPSPIVELNRAVAISMAYGPHLALDLVDQIVATQTLDSYHLLHNVRGDLLDKLGRHAEAAAEFLRSAELATNTAERNLSMQRATETAARA